MSKNVRIQPQYKFSGFIRQYNFRLNDNRFAGIEISKRGQAAFRSLAIKACQGAAIKADEGLQHHQIQHIFSNPALMKECLVADKSTIRIMVPRTPDELVGELESLFNNSHSKGIALLCDIKEARSAEDFDYCFRKTVLEAVKGFSREGIGYDNFSFLLHELVRLADHDLIL